MLRMPHKMHRVLFPLVLTLTLFSIWAAFALLVVNNLFYEDLPGYQIGRICIWEFVAIVISAAVAWYLIRCWGNIDIQKIEGRNAMVLNPKFGLYFIIYFLLAVVVAIWQFWIFSQKF